MSSLTCSDDDTDHQEDRQLDRGAPTSPLTLREIKVPLKSYRDPEQSTQEGAVHVPACVHKVTGERTQNKSVGTWCHGPVTDLP